MIGDENCFHRAISYFYHQTQNFHNNYRNIIYIIWKENIYNLTPFFFKEKNWNVEDIINDYVENIKKEHNDAGDIEIYTMAELLEVNIICYTLEDNKYNLQAVYSGNKLNLSNVNPLQFIDNNHFNILYPQ